MLLIDFFTVCLIFEKLLELTNALLNEFSLFVIYSFRSLGFESAFLFDLILSLVVRGGVLRAYTRRSLCRDVLGLFSSVLRLVGGGGA